MFHAVWFLSVAAALTHLVGMSTWGRPTRATIPAYVLVATQSVAFGLNRGHCPLTDAVTRYAGEDCAVAGHFLPTWIADRLPVAVAAPLLASVVSVVARRAPRGSRIG
jgi:hypothetical protein